MSAEFVLLTLEDYNCYLKLKGQHQKRNEYHNLYILGMTSRPFLGIY